MQQHSCSSAHEDTINPSIPAGRRPAPTAPRPRLLGPASAADPGERTPLRVRLAHTDCTNLLPVQLLRKYIAYAREFCHPALSLAARSVLKAFYLDVRLQAAQAPGLAVNVRPC